MPLPRFSRLPPKRQAQILEVAREHFARDGRDRASFNQIVAEARLPKTSAYQYFDGKDDLAGAVLADVNAQVLAVLGAWRPATSARAFWKQLRGCSRRLLEHLSAHPEHLACLRALGLDQTSPTELEWFGAVIENGVALRVIRRDTDRALLVAVTVGFFRAVDAWALDALATGRPHALNEAWRLLAGLWGGTR